MPTLVGKQPIIAAVAILCLKGVAVTARIPGPPWLVLAVIGAICSVGGLAIIAVLLSS
jgi:hypothetical protein